MVENQNLVEEIFCLKLELDTLASVSIKNEAERWVPGFIGPNIEKDHIDRYIWATDYVSEKKVLDIACGAGRGSYLLGTKGKALEVLGGDINEDAVRYAKHRNKNSNVNFKVQDALALEWVKEFDVIVSFETIEHVPDVKLFLKNIARALKDNGIFMVSTPISSKELDSHPENPYHIQEWGFDNFKKLLDEFFTVEEVYIQLYDAVPLPKKNTLIQRIKNKIFGVPQRDYKMNESKIEKYQKQYPINEIGSVRKGYQLLVCKK